MKPVFALAGAALLGVAIGSSGLYIMIEADDTKKEKATDFSTGQDNAATSSKPLSMSPQSSSKPIDTEAALFARCDQLAGHPDDPYKEGAGISDYQLEADLAANACLDALELDPTDPHIQFQLGRSLMALGEIEEAGIYLAESSEQGYPAASAHLADIFLEQEELSDEDIDLVLELYKFAYENGYGPAKQSYDDLLAALKEREKENENKSLSAVSGAGFNPDRFQRGDIMLALFTGDFDVINKMESGFVMEDAGIPLSFIHYTNSLVETLNQMFVCPTLLDAGISATIKKQTVMQAMSPDTNKQLMSKGFSHFLNSFGNQSKDPYQAVNDFMQPIAKGEALAETLKEMGQKDAYALQRFYSGQYNACDTAVAERIADNLYRYVTGQEPLRN